jgi:hypothetical protein
VKDRHRRRECIEFLKLLDAAYPTRTAIKLTLDNHSAHISKETTAWLARRPAGRFEFTFTPMHGFWLNWSKVSVSSLHAPSCPTSVASKQELKDRITAAMAEINQDPVVHTWSYKLDNRMIMIRTTKTLTRGVEVCRVHYFQQQDGSRRLALLL